MRYPYRLLSNEQLQELMQREIALFIQRTQHFPPYTVFTGSSFRR
jgi:hypothetical protein